MVSALAEELTRRVADGSGTWKVYSDAELWVHPEVWADARRRIAAVMKDLDDAAAAPRTDGTVHVSATALMFEVGAGEPQPNPRQK
jgi:hypothetical protein